MPSPRSIGVIAALAGAPAPAFPQDLPPAIAISYGERVSNFLTPDDATFQDSSRYKAYVFTGRAGDSVTIQLVSADFNANLLLTDSADAVLAADDNSGGDCNAHLVRRLPADGRYVVYANAAAPGERGEFQLMLEAGAHPPQGTAACRGWVGHVGVLEVGTTARDSLEAGGRLLPDSSPFAIWLLPDPGSEAFTVDVSSQAFDAAAILVRGITEVLAVDDDGAGGCDARIAHEPTDRRPRRVVVVSRGPRRSGAYTVSVTAGIRPTVTQPPCGAGGG